MRWAGMSAVLLGLTLVVNGYSQPALKDVLKDNFLTGVALAPAQFDGKHVRSTELVKKHFNSITPENALKWEQVHPAPDRYNFAAADTFVRFGEANHMFIVGHVLVWEQQTPAWVFQNGRGNPATRDMLLKRMRDHIHRVVGRYKGRIGGWDVVNEALEEDGTLRQSPWLKTIGEDYIAKAFQYAHEADPKAELYYNDYSLENEPKLKGAIGLVGKLRARGVPVTAVGVQGHYHMDWPSPEQEGAMLSAFAKLGVRVAITELDIDVLPPVTNHGNADITVNVAAKPELNPYPKELPDVVQQQLAERYAGLFREFVKHRGTVSRVTFWGVTDEDSWLNNWPVRGRRNYPLLFDREGKAKPAFDAIVRVAGAEKSQ